MIRPRARVHEESSKGRVMQNLEVLREGWFSMVFYVLEVERYGMDFIILNVFLHAAPDIS